MILLELLADSFFTCTELVMAVRVQFDPLFVKEIMWQGMSEEYRNVLSLKGGLNNKQKTKSNLFWGRELSNAK